ncbi:haloacid dehalogenase type II [Massilia horti]|uniref:(S)-2-haloacid dehalogenase n=1 Tax=Massilia horti TaxID=2562153 RepID=A0A4Y9SQX4_9BURK|nr:haloacid dehalogenase type II [Massilia horti]TFW28875.1 haloacid dehalogenase type II [Massilia horti]
MNPIKPTVLFFDVIETMLDLAPMQASIGQVLPGADSARRWFSAMLHYAVVMTINNQFAPLPEVGKAVLRMLAEGRGILLEDQDAAEALAPLATLPAHPDVRPALERLRGEGYKLAALSNGATSAIAGQLAHAGLADLFEAQFGVEQVGKFKPAPEVYRWAAEQMGAPPGDCMMVAAHGWDVAGAAWSGMQTAFIKRGEQVPFPLAPRPVYVASSFEPLAQRLSAL